MNQRPHGKQQSLIIQADGALAGAAGPMRAPAAGAAKPDGVLSVFDAVTIMVGLVVGVGIFKTPSIVAAKVGSDWSFILVWVAGGLVTLVGALCYAELSAGDPDAGGESQFLSRAYGRPVAMLFGWARCTGIQAGGSAGVSFMLGDYV